MTIRQKLFISFSLILLITLLIIGVFFYSIYNLNEVHMSQKHRYDQIRRVEQLKEYNNDFSWVVLDIITDYDKINVVKERLHKADELFRSLLSQKQKTIQHSETQSEKENLQLIFSYFDNIKSLISYELYALILTETKEKNFDNFNQTFGKISYETQKLIIEEIEYLQNRLNQTERKRNQFIDTIKIELIGLLFIAFIVSFVISSKIIKEIKEKLDKLNQGVLHLFNDDDENTIKVDIGKNNELSEITNNLNSYLEKQADIIHSREELLRNISHELKTPITKGKFLLEDFKHTQSKDVIININSVFVDIEELTSKLLQREKLNFATLNLSHFKVSSLILESLSKLFLDDESKIVLNIEEDFTIEADKYYLTIVLKNLIDNAIKYAQEYPIEIHAHKNTLHIKNIAPKLSNDLVYYIRPFTREPNQQSGHGLGLNIVNKILQKHRFTLHYTHTAPHNIFSIVF
ncbi:MAG: ATP-binding protein [Arcobacteraceae bacterium]